MIVRTLEECENSERKVDGGNWQSVRMLLKDDNMGFSFHITTILAGTETPIHYQNHLESVYCMSGNGEIETVEDGKIYKTLIAVAVDADGNDLTDNGEVLLGDKPCPIHCGGDGMWP